MTRMKVPFGGYCEVAPENVAVREAIGYVVDEGSQETPLESMTAAELRALAAERGIRIAKKASKQEIIEKLGE